MKYSWFAIMILQPADSDFSRGRPERMNKKCIQCGLINFQTSQTCQRCGVSLSSVQKISNRNFVQTENDLGARLNAGVLWFFKRFMTAVFVTTILLFLAYFSMLLSAAKLVTDQQIQVSEAISYLDERGFEREAFLLRWSAYRSNDNWFNALTGHADAYAATNFPFQIITLYDHFFSVSADKIERASILLHEAQHLQGAGEAQAYEYVWHNREKLGWTRNVYQNTKVYRNVLGSTKQFAPQLFRCEWNPENDCTQ